MDVRLGNFGRATRALRTESRSKSTDVSHSRIAHTGFFLSKRRHANPQGRPFKSDDVFSLGASIYAALVDVDTRSKKFYKVCEVDFNAKYPLMKEVVKTGERFGEESEECKLVFDLTRIVETCSLAEGATIEYVCKKFRIVTRKLVDFEYVAFDAADELKSRLRVRSFDPDETWEPINNLIKYF